MSWIWIVFGALVGAAGVRYRARVRAARAAGAPPALDDDAIRRIMEEGTLSVGEEDEPLDLEEAARAEEEFWDESWDEPEEYRP
jgi:hypothetical protein